MQRLASSASPKTERCFFINFEFYIIFMRHIFLVILFILLSLSISSAQKRSELPVGFPDRSSKLDVLPGFVHPPEGYGEVPFYWWLGDTLTIERITSQLDQLKDKGITGLQINYCHSDKGGLQWGLTYPSQPALFSKDWWTLFQQFMKEAKKRNMSVSLSDYTLGAAGQGWFVDEMLHENPGLYGSKLESKQFEVSGNQSFTTKLPDKVVSVKAYRMENGNLQSSSAVDLTSAIHDSELQWKPASGEWKIIVVYVTVIKTSFDPMNPLSGQKVIENFYQRFEDHCPGESGKGLNFFFSDELNFGISGFLWNAQFADEFKKRKGYDIIPKVDQLFAVLGPESYKTRLDYNDVMVALSEEGFFKQVYDWHTSRGMLFGCDHGGRGKEVMEFGDYFRTQRWMSGPGSDQPNLGKDIVKAKVASSITHLYERPRTWLEGYYGSGWGTSSEEIADATFANFAMGYNLLSLHGLYYSTHGSMWEWAAPDNHFRQPYWKDMGVLLKCTERLSYVLSQGYHCCPVAIIYPVAPMVANIKGNESVQTAFNIANELYPKGIDLDFMDYESLNRSKVKDAGLQVSGEKYKLLILPALTAVRYSTIEKALAFFRAGGTVLAVGALPEVSDKVGDDALKLQAMIREMFGTTYSDVVVDKTYSRKSKAGGVGMFIPQVSEVKGVVDSLLEPDFKVVSENVTSSIQHRRVGNRDLYFVYGVAKGTACFFHHTGKAELWNPWDGTVKPLKVASVSKSGTVIHLPLEKNEPQLIVFSNGKSELEEATEIVRTESDTLDTQWEFELLPTLDNTYGDYRLPAYDAKIGVEVWDMKFAEQTPETANRQAPDMDDSKWSGVTVGYGAQFLQLGPLPATTDLEALESALSKMETVDRARSIEMNGKQYYWKPFEFSWRRGMKDDVGHQGYHGLKGVVNNELISLGIVDKSNKTAPLYGIRKEPEGTVYYLWTTVSAFRPMQAKISKGGLLPVKVVVNQSAIDPASDLVNLKSGNNAILLKYNNVGRGYFVFEDGSLATDWRQTVPLATDWYLKPSVLPFNCFPQRKDNWGWYCLMTPPGARTMYIATTSQPEVWVSGVRLLPEPTQSQSNRMGDKNQKVWKVTIPDSMITSGLVTLKVKQLPAYYGGAAIAEPITFECSKGEIHIGNLDANESLRTYSGGMKYSKKLLVNAQQAKAHKVTLNLGDLVSSAEVYLNGQLIGQKVTSPWQFDVTGKWNEGENKLEVIVFNTLGNHYLTTPSQYVGRTKSGLIGPVRIEYSYLP